MNKSSELKKIEEEIAADNALPLQGANLVFGEGSPGAEVVFIGEAPGKNEDEQIRPFVGRAGQLLRQCIRGIGWKEEDVYITNIVKRRPPENRDPLPDEIDAYKSYLTRQLAAIKPKIIVALGRFSMNYFLPEAKISRDHGKVFRFDGSTLLTAGGFLLYPIYHPAAALRSTQMKEEFEKNFKKLPKILEKADELLDGSMPQKGNEEKFAQKELF
ncbi:MAG TPA: uracil-DNA glycosylase [Candidatus Paceibacterota bacterium]|nr:uracil-DNA glycosylase [Candidatus Paceibacterota bacterium]